jgi:hypothetical protein
LARYEQQLPLHSQRQQPLPHRWSPQPCPFLLAAAAPPSSIFATPSSPACPFHSLRLVAGSGRAAAARALVVADATKKAVVVLKGTSEVEGVVTLTQEDDGAFCFHIPISPQTFRNLCVADVLGGKRKDLF